MFWKLEGYTAHKVGGSGGADGDEITVYVPPAGTVWDYLEGKLVPVPIYTRSDNPEEQYWERPIDPTYNYDRALEVEQAKQQTNPYYIDTELESFCEQEWFRRINGFWFMNHGVPTYITGAQYFYLTWWKIDTGGYPAFRTSDREFFWLWKYIEDDPDSFGLVEAARRRSGKTIRATCLMYEYTSRTYQAQAGMQSKTGADAQKVFNRLVNSFRSCPFFMKPVYDTAAGDRPKKKLVFLPKSSLTNTNPDEELGGEIDYASHEIIAYDSTKKHRYLRDECGKTTLSDIYDGWDIVKFCLSQGSKTIIGKALYTTTIEEGGSIPFKLLWDGSNPAKRDPETHRTRTGMYRIFVPAFKNDDDYIDKYGNCDHQASMEEMQKVRRSLASKPRELASYKRKNPFTIQEAFFSINDESIYDTLKLTTQMEALSFMDEDHWFVRGNFQWKNGIGSDVIFVENFNGRWHIHRKWLEAVKKDSRLTNNYEKVGDRYKLTSGLTGITGADTFDHSKKNLSDDSQASNAAFYTLIKHDPMISEEFDDTFIIEYVYRQPTADLMAEDLLMQCVFTSTPAIIESNKPGAISFFERHGYHDYIIEVNGKQGVPGSMPNKQQMAETTEIYIEKHCEKVVFSRLLMDWNYFSLEDSTKFDSAMGAGWGLLIAYRLGKKFVKKPEHRDMGRPTRKRSATWYSKHL